MVEELAQGGQYGSGSRGGRGTYSGAADGYQSGKPARARDDQKEVIMKRFFGYLANNPYSTVAAVLMLVKAADTVIKAAPAARIDVLTSGDVTAIILGGVALLTGQDPKAIKKDE